MLIALTNNVDNVGVCIAYSVAGIRLGAAKNLWISILTFLISALFALLGAAASGAAGRFPCQILSAAILTSLGLALLLEPKIKNLTEAWNSRHPRRLLNTIANPESSDADGSKSIDFREATLLGISLSINNAGGCLGAGVMGINAVLIGVLSAAFSFVSCGRATAWPRSSSVIISEERRPWRPASC